MLHRITMKQFKLKIHQQNYSDALLIFNTSDLPDVKTFDLLKIHHCNGSANDFVLVQVISLKDGEMAKDTISIEATLAQSFGLKVFQDVYVYKTEPEDVALDLFEVSFKDQYISRSDMWRMKKTFLNSCVYIDQYLPFSGIRAQVSELWSNSMKVRCGYITDNTNFVLRSYTAEVYVFIQMSSEMWEYDAYGYLQFERAINGFLKALFKKWKQKKCCHELTLVLFSRTLYETQDIEDFPIHLRDCLRRNYQNQLYMDFYKCVVQTERLEDCTSLITTLKRLFNKYEKLTELDGCPKGINSTSSEGNFLEAINLSLNVFEQHHINRNFDRTGQIVVCITPGVGVFDVDRKLTVLTKERMIDNGIGSDLICLGQQPLHAVPLFKFHYDQQQKKSFSFPKRENFPTSNSSDFNIPHWINHSFYTSNPFPDEGTTNITYIPRIRHPIMEVKEKSQVPTLPVNNVTNKDTQLPSLQHINYDDFDNQVFKYQQPLVKRRNGNESIVFKHNKFKSEDLFNMENTTSEDDIPSRPLTRPVHIPITKQHHLLNNQAAASSLGSNDRYRPNNEKIEACLLVGSAHAGHGHLSKQHVVGGNSRALFNPFKPSHMYARLTANRRRWVHTYPRGPQGEALVLHHLQSREKQSRSREISESYENETVINASCASLESPVSYKASTQHALGGTDGVSLSSSLASSNPSLSSNDNLDTLLQNSSLHKGMRLNKPISSYGFSWMWGIAGDLQWTSQTNTGCYLFFLYFVIHSYCMCSL
uniref:GATOR complex protein DEPDC5-like isoform X2 n=1 Tax=Ciona intestinalis TaxID=7719 RepID=UPI000EF4692A|nr:GATOR complex protein DEPDC5-like isoform X2 [Ciona intestinalis]|eukprot:XP_026695007.1 GATOR complex protein DEPDC5-like isoform X2 [Ciona intestinalis]